MIKYSGNRKIFFFFPYYHIGGAEKVHSQIINCFSGENCLVFFTDRSRDNKNKKEFYKKARCFNFFGITNKIKILEKVFIYFLCRIINRSNAAIVFGSNSRFFYSLLEKLDDNVKKIDLVHWLDGEIGRIIIGHTDKIDKRLVVTKGILPVLAKEYNKSGISTERLNNITVIENRVTVKEEIKKNYSSNLHVLYVGRDTPEKRPELAFKVPSNLKSENIDFIFIGRGLLKVAKKIGCQSFVKDRIDSDEELNDIYKRMHIIILTSVFEGFPCALMEAMSFGVVPITTAVGGIPIHLKQGENALLVNSDDEKDIVAGIAKYIKMLDSNRNFLKILSHAAYQYAKQNFSSGNFCADYKKIISH